MQMRIPKTPPSTSSPLDPGPDPIPIMNPADLQSRLTSLGEEFAAGQKLLADYEAKAAAVREQLLRIDGAMRVLSELLGQDNAAQGSTDVASEGSAP